MCLQYQRRSFRWLDVRSTLDVDAVEGTQPLLLDEDVPLMQAGMNSVAAIRLASKLRESMGVEVAGTLLFEHPSARAIAAHLEELRVSATVESTLILIEDVLSSVAQFAPGNQRAGDNLTATLPVWQQFVASGDDCEHDAQHVYVSAGLTCLRAANAGIPLFCAPAGNGSANGYLPLADICGNPIFSIVHPHLQTGSPSDLQATTIEAVADVWAVAVLEKCELEDGNSVDFCLIGTSTGGLLAHLIALAAHKHGLSPVLEVLVDPMTPVHPISRTLPAGPHMAARYLIGITGDSTFEIPSDASEADLGILVAQRDTELGRAPFELATILERQRELRATTHLLTLQSAFFRGQDARASAYKVYGWGVCLVLASGREHFYETNVGLSQEEASAATARLYGNVVCELRISGDHLTMCARCISGDVAEFNNMLKGMLLCY